jgi:SAM-dependent methyltransferase
MTNDAQCIIGLYQRHGLAWDADRRRAHFVEREWLGRFAALLPPNGHVLDLGCGGAEPMAGALIGQGFSVTGIDSAPQMIGLCRTRHPTQEWQVGDMRTLSLGRAFDGIIAWDSFFHLTPDDQRSMFPVFGVHAAASAVLLFSSGPRNGEAIGSYGGEPLYHSSLDPGEYRALLGDNGFTVVDHVAGDPNCGGHTVWLARAQ